MKINRKNILRNRIELIAKILSEKQNSIKNKEKTNEKGGSNESPELNLGHNKIVTIKDKLSYIENENNKANVSNEDKSEAIKKCFENTTLLKNEKLRSTLSTKRTRASENINSNLGINVNTYDSNIKFDDSYTNKTNKNLTITNEDLEKIVDLNTVNIEELKKIRALYTDLVKYFQINILESGIKTNSNPFNKLDKELNENYLKCKILAYDFFKFLFDENMETIITVFKYSIDLNKYILYQIYLFLSIIYLECPTTKSKDFCKMMSYRSVFQYSLQNFDILINCIENISLLLDEKLTIKLNNTNKIIFSILKTLSPNLPNNDQILEFLMPNYINVKLRSTLKKENTYLDKDENPIKIHPFIFNDNQYETKNLSRNKIPFSSKKEFTYNTGTDNNNIKTLDENKCKYYNLLKLIKLLKTNKELLDKLKLIELKAMNIINTCKNLNTELAKSEKEDKKNLYEKKIIKVNLNNIVNKKYYKNILPNIEKYFKYTIVMDLDETLVHYCEEENSYYVKVRFDTENFLEEINKFCEIIIITNSGKEYSDIIIDNLNKEKCCVNHRIYTEEYDSPISMYNLNRNLNKTLFITHLDKFLDVPNDKLIQIKEFNGEENDKEIEKLKNLILLNLQKDEITNVSDIILEIKQKLQN